MQDSQSSNNKKEGIVDKVISINEIDKKDKKQDNIKCNDVKGNKFENEEEKIDSKISSPSSSINFISSLTKANTGKNSQVSYNPITQPEPFHAEPEIKYTSEHQGIKAKRNFKKIKRNNKREITINLISLPQEDQAIQRLLHKNYCYLLENFSDKIDDYSQIMNECKSNINEEKINEYFRDHPNNNSFNFGDEPIKLYKDAVYSTIKKKGRSESIDTLQQIVSSLPVLEAPDTVWNTLNKNAYSCYMFSPYQINKIKNENKDEVTKEENTKYLNKKRQTDVHKSKNVCNNCNKSKEQGEECKCDCQSENVKEGDKAEDSERIYNCTLCSCTFASPQGLGGHMSRTHSFQSLKFNKKREIRNSREHLRKQLEKSKKIMCDNYNKNYLTLVKTKQGKEIIKQLISTHQKEYKLIRKKLAENNWDKSEE